MAYKRYMFVSHSSRGWEVQDHGTGQFSLPGKLPFWFTGAIFSLVEGVRGHSGVSYESTNPIHERSPYALITFQRPNILTPLQWELGFQYMNFGGHKLESRLPGETSTTSDMQMTPP